MPSLLRVVDCAGLADDVDFDLSRILQFGLDLLRNVTGQKCDGIVTDFIRLRDDSDLTTSLDRVGILNALRCIGDLFELLKTLDVGLEGLTPCARSRSRQRIRRRDQNRFD